ncbi:MAG: hypothetical protein ACYS5F_13745 [Planctomycetota bacterium]|jgi:hypothetical protein
MRKEKCELCSSRIEPGYIEIHHVIPTYVTEQAGLPESQTLRLCRNCHREVCVWYTAKVSDITYNSETKRLITRSWVEMVKEYDAAFNSFMKHKKQQDKLGMQSPK